MRYRLIALTFLVLLIGSFSYPAVAASPEEEIIERLIRLEEGQKALGHRIDDLRGLLYVILAGMFVLVGFVIWDRRTALAPAIRRTAILEDALKEFAKEDPKMAEVLRHLGIM